MLILGIDIGGTHTDAVLIDREGRLVASSKCKTTPDVHQGIEEAFQQLNIDAEHIREVRIGTTHAINALLEGKALSRVGVIRLTGQQEALIPVGFGFPAHLAQQIVGTHSLPGGMEFDGKARGVPLNEQIDTAVQQLITAGAEIIVISGSFSPLYPLHEEAIAARIDAVPTVSSHMMSGLGFIERENTAILNALLKHVLKGFSLDIDAPLFVTQNEGSIMKVEEAIDAPIMTLSSGQTNSFIGAAKLMGLEDAVVVDIGGTSTDVGVIDKGFPRKSMGSVDIASIPLNFPLPDVISIAIGGGTLVKESGSLVSFGPESCGSRLFEDGVSFGGIHLTLTDLALRADFLSIPGADPRRVTLSPERAQELLHRAFMKIKALITKMQSSTRAAPVIIVGGGADLFRKWCQQEGYLLPEHHSVANAYGAALAEIACTIDRTIIMGETEMDALKAQAIDQTIQRGARPESVRLTRVEIIPYHYLEGQRARVIISAAGKTH